MIYPQHDRVCQRLPRPFGQGDTLADPAIVARVRPRTSKGHHRPVIASNFHSMILRSGPSKKYATQPYQEASMELNMTQTA